METEAGAVASEVLAALESGRQVEPFTMRVPGFDAAAAYAVAEVLRSRRSARGERPVGRKIGFTNRNIWAEYSVYQPIWGDVYDTTVVNVTPGSSVRISHLPQPRIEPEIVLGLDGDLSGGMDIEEIAARIGWVAHGFEVVQSIYPDWHCSVADCVADGGLHGLLCVGPKRLLPPAERSGLALALSGLTVELSCNGQPVDRGVGSNVLDGPVHALRHLADLLSKENAQPPLRSGEMISTGTITRAFPIAPGERWSTALSGFDLPGLDVAFR